MVGSLSVALAYAMNEKGVRCIQVLDNQSIGWVLYSLNPSRVSLCYLLVGNVKYE